MIAAPHSSAWEGFHVIQGRRAYAPTPMGQVHYSELGNGPPLLLIHQSPWFGVQYAKAQPILAARGLSVIAPDTPGFGLSDVPSSPPNIEDYADNLIALLDHLGVERAAIAGHHTGASIAAAFAARHPDRTRCLVMHGVPLYTEAERAERLATQAQPHTAMHADGSHIAARWARIAKFFGATATTESIQWSVLSFLLAGDLEWYGHRAAFSFDMAAVIPKITAPTLIMSNTADTIHHAAARVLKLRPDFAYHEMAGGNSHMMYDDPAPWAKIVGDFVVGQQTAG